MQTIRDGKRILGIEDMKFDVGYVEEKPSIGKRAEIFLLSKKRAKIVLFLDAKMFSVRHELCHAKLYRMGFPLTNTEMDLKLFPNPEDYARMVVINEWYINELQKRVFHEYYAVDEEGTPRRPPFEGLPGLPEEKFSQEQIAGITKIAKREAPATI